ncbi:MAG: nuclear transport factor 2 family protein [Chryseolinea sp.]
MENTAFRELLETYYEGFAKKNGWGDVISEDFKFIGGDLTKAEPIVGKTNYYKVIERFSRVFETMRVKNMIIDGDEACVIGNYDFKFPNGTKINGNVAEIWKVKNGKLAALTIFFDTMTFQSNTK